MKKRFLSICLSLALVGSLITSTGYSVKADAVSYNGTSIDANLNATAVPDHITLSWTKDPTTTQTITWRTATSDVSSNIQYRIAGSTTWIPGNKLTPSRLTSGTGDATVTTGTESIYSDTIINLSSGKTYEYQIIGTDASGNTYASGTSTFTTETSNNTTTKFIVFGDSQSGIANNPEYTAWNNTIQEAYNQNKDANFVVNVGDLVEIGQNYQHWNNWYLAAKGVIDNIPEMPVQGNHETYQTNNYDTSSPKDFVSQFSVPQNGPYGHVGQTYSYNYGNVHFVVLDSQEDEEAAGDDTFLKQQADWLDSDLSNNKQKWTVVMYHKTAYYNKKTRNNPAVKDIFTPVIEKHHVDIVFNGHDHGISRTYPINGNNYYTDYSKGTVYYVTGRSGNKCYTDLNNKVWDANFADCQDSPSYEVVSVVNGKLTVTAYKYNTLAPTVGPTSANPKFQTYATPTVVDTLTIDKDNPANSTPLTLTAGTNTGLAIAGALQSGYSATVSNNKAYIDPSLIAKYYGGTYDTAALTLTVNKTAYKFASTDLLNGDTAKVNIDALYKQGIDVSYNTQLNDILVDFTGRITADKIAAFTGFTIGTVPTPAAPTPTTTTTTTTTAATIQNQAGSSNLVSAIQTAIKNNTQVPAVDVTSSTVVSKDVFNAIKGQDKTITFTGNNVTWTFNGKDITSTVTSDIDLSLKTVTDALKAKEAAKIKNVTGKDANIAAFSFNYDGQLPGKATVKVFIGKDWANKTVNVCRYYADTNTYKIAQSNVKVDADGYLTYTTDHCSDYFVTDSSVITNLPQTGSAIDFSRVIEFGALVLIIGIALLAAGSIRKKFIKEA